MSSLGLLPFLSLRVRSLLRRVPREADRGWQDSMEMKFSQWCRDSGRMQESCFQLRYRSLPKPTRTAADDEGVDCAIKKESGQHFQFFVLNF